jgi:hypothetical protein
LVANQGRTTGAPAALSLDLGDARTAVIEVIAAVGRVGAPLWSDNEHC